MNIQNNFLQQYHPIARRTKSNARANVQPDFQRNFDNYYSSLNDQNAGNVSNPMPSAPQNVKDAWAKAEQEIGKENLGVAPDGKLSHISGYMLSQLEQRFQTGSGDMFGNSVDSALAGAQKILERLNNPLSPQSSAEAAAYQEKEKLFYQKFIENLTATQSATTAKEVSPAEIYEQMTGRAVSTGEASYDLSQDQIDELKSRYDIENITAEDYQSLMKELAEMGVISKNEVGMVSTEGGVEFTRRPIIVGLYPQDVFKQNFSYDSFKKGNFLKWAQNLVEKNDNRISWIMNSGKDYNSAKINEENVKRLQGFNDSVNRTLRVLNQLK